MTTIAYRSGVLAADSGVSMGETKVGNAVKIRRNNAGDLAGAAGTLSFAEAFLNWFDGGEKGAMPCTQDGDDFIHAAIFRSDGTLETYDYCGKHTLTAPYYAMGSGTPIALGAMFAGADAETAVRAGIEHNSISFGPVTALRHSD